MTTKETPTSNDLTPDFIGELLRKDYEDFLQANKIFCNCGKPLDNHEPECNLNN